VRLVRGPSVLAGIHCLFYKQMVPPFRLLRHRACLVALLFLSDWGWGSAAEPQRCRSSRAHWDWAQKPPMGWNSWDCFGGSVTEAQTKAHADYMAANLKQFGYEYVVVDIWWYNPDATGYSIYSVGANLTMDYYGRLIPAENRFPSAANGMGFKALADYVHAKGLKFGIHMMRGIPRNAFSRYSPIWGTNYTARDIANTSSTCRWNADMYGVDVARPGAQEYYNSVVALWTSWGVDFVKIDDLSSDPGLLPPPYYAGEIEAYRQAIDNAGRAIVLSTSPGPTPLGQGPHIMQDTNMWRISDDFWDDWNALLRMFTLVHNWTQYRRPGHFPDADMLPLGKIGAGNANPNGGRSTNFTIDEQYTLMTLWSIARSPLIYGGDLTRMDPFTLALITNPEVIAVNQNSYGNRQLFNQNGLYAWVANVPNSTDKYLALFNTRDAVTGQTGTAVTANLAEVGFTGTCQIRDLWQRTDLGDFSNQVTAQINWHGAKLYRVSGAYVPLPPSTLAATGGDHQVELVWDAATGASSYDIFRASSSGGPYVSIASGITGTSYVDTDLANGLTYFYVISSVTDQGQSGNSTEVSATPVGSCSPGWSSLDLGRPALAGDAGFADNIYIIRGGGADIGGTADSFHFHWQRLANDGTLIARVRSLGNTDPEAKAGVMFREDGTAGSRHGFMFVTPEQAVFQYRGSLNSNATNVQTTANNNAMRWVKLVRKGNIFYGYHSNDGATWTSSGNVTISMPQSLLAGLAVTAHNDSAVTTASFDFVTFVPASSIPADGSFRVLQLNRSGSDMLLVIPSVSGKTYQLQRRSALETGAWQNIGAPQGGTGDLLTFPDPGGLSGSRLFYRVSRSP
jgi:alpha-galactosidase